MSEIVGSEKNWLMWLAASKSWLKQANIWIVSTWNISVNRYAESRPVIF
jgi:hypothetical protein